MMVTLSFGQVCSLSSQFDFLKIFGFKSIIQDFGHFGYYSDTLLEISDEYRAASSPANINLYRNWRDSFYDFKPSHARSSMVECTPQETLKLALSWELDRQKSV